jgi:hypothetical protein
VIRRLANFAPDANTWTPGASSCFIPLQARDLSLKSFTSCLVEIMFYDKLDI